jgi:ABC-type branched-subunit amino acid transport system permease subunit
MGSKQRAFMTQYALIALFAVIYLAIGFVVQNSYYQLMMTLVLIWATMGLGWNVLSGYSGMISFGHAAFFGLGAYTVTIAFVKFGVTPWLGIPLGILVGVIAGVLIGIPTFRLRGHYFALSMLAYPLAMLYVFEWLGYQEVSLPMKRENPVTYMQFSDQRIYMLISMIVMVACMIMSLHVERSRFGRSLLAIKQNQPAAEAAGINAARWKMLAMMLSAGIAAAAGGLYAIILLVVTPQTVFGALVSAQALIVALFGGDRVSDLDPAGRDATRRTWQHSSGHPGCSVWASNHRHYLGRARGNLLEGARSRYGAPRNASESRGTASPGHYRGGLGASPRLWPANLAT